MGAVNLIVTGRVQGVGFRWFTQRQARNLGLAGWVKNRYDGSVEIWAEGPDGELESLKDAVGRGPAGSFVRRVEVRPATPTGRYFQFDITF